MTIIESSPNALERQKLITSVTWLGVWVNIVLATFKITAGIYGSSRALVADGIHSLSDLPIDAAILIGNRIWSKPRDHDHPYGHGRYEQVVTIIAGLVLALAGLYIGYEAIATWSEPHDSLPGLLAFSVAIASIVTKEALYRWTVRIGRQANSSAVIANAWHHRSDALSAIPVAISIAVTWMYPTLLFVDHIAAAAVALFILQAAGTIIFPSLGQLVDSAPPARLLEAVLMTAGECEEVVEAHALRMRYVGPNLALDIHILVDPDTTVRNGHDIAENMSKKLKDRFPEIADVVVHIEPANDDDHDSHH